MLRTVLSQASRLCEPLAWEVLTLQQGCTMQRQAAAQTLVTLRRFSTEDRSSSSPQQRSPSSGGAQASPKGVQQWRQWVDAKIGEKLEGAAEEAAEDKPAAAAVSAEPTAAAEAAPAAAQELQRPADVEEELRELLQPAAPRHARRTVEQEIFEIVVPPSQGADAPSTVNYKQLSGAKEAPRLFPGGSNRADEVSPDRIHPYRLFYPGQLYAPQDLDPYTTKEAGLFPDTGSRARQQTYISTAEVEAKADFRNAQFLTSFVTDAGRLVPRRRTRLQHKLHRHLCRQIKIARNMAILPPDSRLPQYQLRKRAPSGAQRSTAALQAAAAKQESM